MIRNYVCALWSSQRSGWFSLPGAQCHLVETNVNISAEDEICLWASICVEGEAVKFRVKHAELHTCTDDTSKQKFEVWGGRDMRHHFSLCHILTMSCTTHTRKAWWEQGLQPFYSIQCNNFIYLMNRILLDLIIFIDFHCAVQYNPSQCLLLNGHILD